MTITYMANENTFGDKTAKRYNRRFNDSELREHSDNYTTDTNQTSHKVLPEVLPRC